MTEATEVKRQRCPDCGSPDAVGKDVAWDALCKVPEKVQKELDAARAERDALRAALLFADDWIVLKIGGDSIVRLVIRAALGKTKP